MLRQGDEVYLNVEQLGTVGGWAEIGDYEKDYIIQLKDETFTVKSYISGYVRLDDDVLEHLSFHDDELIKADEVLEVAGWENGATGDVYCPKHKPVQEPIIFYKGGEMYERLKGIQMCNACEERI